MKRSTLLLSTLFSLCLALPSLAQTVGGHNETSEGNSLLWTVAAHTAGTAPAGASTHLLISEFSVTPTPVEYIEIMNPTLTPIDLTNVYLSDAWFEDAADTVGYHTLPSGIPVGTNTDFIARFPAGTLIGPGQALVIAFYGPGVDSAIAPGTADFEITSVSPMIPDMINVGGSMVTAGTTGLTNGSEMIVLFGWDGASDLVCDIDYVTWGPATSTSRVDKTGQAVDGPDGDAIATAYLTDTADASQSTTTPNAMALQSTQRTSGVEGAETSPGNGCLTGSTDSKRPTWGELKLRYR